MRVRLLAAVLMLGTGVAVAAAPPPKKGGTKLDLGLPKTFNSIPTGEGLEKPAEKKDQQGPTTTTTNLEYSVVKVTHRKQKSTTPIEQVATDGNPATTEEFSTVVRVKCAQKQNAPIDVVILDPRSDTLMEASGQIFFRGSKEDEVDYTVDWARTQLPRGTGNYQVLIRVAGNPLGTFPLKIADPPPKK